MVMTCQISFCSSSDGWSFRCRKKARYSPEAHFIAVHFVGIQPDSMLGEFRIVERRPVSIGIVIHSLAAEPERTVRDGDHR